ncbi:hypothetical protein AWZ03_002530 [Drosophila navojoa]|uniref:Uncharacterized protein n=1 Tax=Drosophila navojoa TaxID=7232 RepID=A0A484BQW1_DRONA|nr:hypothetical protein AWZ03_002530 [Drosophila navojoa]
MHCARRSKVCYVYVTRLLLKLKLEQQQQEREQQQEQGDVCNARNAYLLKIFSRIGAVQSLVGYSLPCLRAINGQQSFWQLAPCVVLG